MSETTLPYVHYSERDAAGTSRMVTVLLWTILGLVALVTIFSPWLMPHSPTETDLLNKWAPPSATHPLGTDSLGRDILSRIIDGSRLSILGPLVIVASSVVAGTALSVSSVWIGGWYRVIVARVLDLLFSTPSLLVAILAVAFVGPGVVAPVVALSIAYTPYVARVVQSVAVRDRNLPYIESATLVGFSGWAICLRHLVPNILPVIRAQATVLFGSALLDLAAISFLGLGAQPPSSAWGLMVAQGVPAMLSGHVAEALAPAVVILLLVIVVNLAGDRFERQTGRPS